MVTDGHLRLVPEAASPSRVKAISPPIRRQRHESLRDFHPSAGHDHAPHAGHHRVRRAGLSAAAGCRSPSVDMPTIRVSAALPGASPETMASSVALPLEKQFTTISGLTSINSTSTQGGTDITLQFDLSRDIDAAAQDVQAMIGRASRQLPSQMPHRRHARRSTPATSRSSSSSCGRALPLSTIDEIAQTTVAQRISMVNGVAQVNVFGSQKHAVRIDVDPRALAARSIGIDEVATAIQNANANLPRNHLRRAHVRRADQRAADAGVGVRPTIVSYRNGNPVHLSEVAHVYDGVENDKTASWQNGERCVYLSIQKQPGINVVQTVDAIKVLLRRSAPNCRPRSRSTSAATAPSPSASRWTT